MPAYIVEKLPNEPIILYAMSKNFSVNRDLESSAQERQSLLDAQPEPVYLIMDYSEISVSFDDLMVALNRLGRGTATLYHHPNIGKLLVVAPSPVFRHSFENMAASELYGHLESAIFYTRAEALEFARAGR